MRDRSNRDDDADARERLQALEMQRGWTGIGALMVLALYLALAAPVIGEGDAGEFTLVLATAGVPHPTGYPLYTLLGHVFCRSLHLLGMSWAHAANAWSAAGATVAVVLFALLSFRLATSTGASSFVARLATSLAATSLLALNPVWISVAVQAEVHSWHLAWAVGLCLLALTLARRFMSADEREGSGTIASAAAWGLLSGVGLSHHLTSLLLILPLTVVLARMAARSRRGWSVPAAWLVGLLLPLASYGFLAYRAFNPAAFQWPLLEPSWSGVVDHALGGVYGVFVGHFNPTGEQMTMMLTYMAPLIIPGLAGLLWIALRAIRKPERSILLALFVAAMLYLAFVFIYGVRDPVAYLLTPLMIALLAVPVGVAQWSERAPASVLTTAAALILVVAGAIGLGSAFEIRREATKVHEIVRSRWDAIPFRRGIVLWANDYYTHLKVIQILNGERPELRVVNPNLLTWPGPKRAFMDQLGFDPLAGLDLRVQDDVRLIGPNIQRQTALPVVDFSRIPANPPRHGR